VQLKVGNYPFPVNAATIGRSFKIMESPDGVPYGEVHSWDVSGELLGNGQADLITTETTLRTSLGLQYQDLVFYADDGVTVAAAMPNLPSLTGVKIKEYSVPQVQGSVYATFVPFSFRAEATYIYGNGPAVARDMAMLEFQEVLQISGGGQRYGLIECVDAPAVSALVTPFAVCRATQHGSSKGLGTWPEPPGPIWPEYLIEAPDIEKTSPRRTGVGYVEYATAWTYKFESPSRLNGVPMRVL